jgi:hypothetical protein
VFFRYSFALLFAFVACLSPLSANEGRVFYGYAEKDITPQVTADGPPVWLAGYGFGRKASGVHDPLLVRCMVLKVGDEKIAIAAVDLIGLQHEAVLRIREKVQGFKHLTINSTHNHEGPDVIGIWGKTPFQRGVNEAYIDLVVEQTCATIMAASENLQEVTAAMGTAEDATLVDDKRLPDVKDPILRVLRLNHASSEKPAGIMVQWSCHPETLGPKNQQVTADFPAYTIAALKEKYQCPILYITGTVGGLQAPPEAGIVNAAGETLAEGDFEYCRIYGEKVAALAEKAINSTAPLQLGAPQIGVQKVSFQIHNKLYRLARQFGILKREAREWKGNAFEWGDVITEHQVGQLVGVMSEVSYVRMGELHMLNIPGEIYPELVYGQFQEPVEPNADFPEAPLEPTVVSLLPNQKWMLFGLANDEIGYIIPKRQWDEKAPFCYDKEKGQYGEINSCGPETAATIMEALQRCIRLVNEVTVTKS